jgi:hypothetical protein
MTEKFFISKMKKLLDFISKYNNINFKCASEIRKYKKVNPKTKLLPYISAINKNIAKTYFKSSITKTYGA